MELRAGARLNVTARFIEDGSAVLRSTGRPRRTVLAGLVSALAGYARQRREVLGGLADEAELGRAAADPEVVVRGAAEDGVLLRQDFTGDDAGARWPSNARVPASQWWYF